MVFDLDYPPTYSWVGVILYLCSQGEPDIPDIKHLRKATKISTLRK